MCSPVAPGGHGHDVSGNSVRGSSGERLNGSGVSYMSKRPSGIHRGCGPDMSRAGNR